MFEMSQNKWVRASRGPSTAATAASGPLVGLGPSRERLKTDVTIFQLQVSSLCRTSDESNV